LWPVIGARLDFVQFHATDGEPARSGPGTGLQLAQIYQVALQDFDNWYITQMLESRKNALNNFHAQRNPQQMQQLMVMSHTSVAELRAQGVDEKMIHFVEQNRANLQRSFQDQRMFQNRVRTAQAGGGPHAQAAAIAMQQNGGHPQGQPHGRPVAPGMGGPGASLPFANSPQQQQQNATATLAARNQFAVGVPQFVQQGPQANQQQQVPGGQNMQAARMMQQGQQRSTLAAADALIQRIKHEYTTNSMSFFFFFLDDEHG
jgi:hypothetical protein